MIFTLAIRLFSNIKTKLIALKDMNRLVSFLIVLCPLVVSNLKAQEKRSIDSLVFIKSYSKILNEDRKIVVHLPLNYYKEVTKKYPVMYVLDAGRLDFDISDRLFTLSSAGLTQECIVIGIINNKNTRERDMTPPFMQTEVDDEKSPYGKAHQFLHYIESELIPFIDSNYRTTEYQTISGHSRSGLFVLYTLIECPNLFHARFCYSTPAWRFDNMIINKLNASLKNMKHFPKCYLFFSVGEDKNPNIKSSFSVLDSMLNQKNIKGLKWNSYLTPMANHQSNSVFSTAKALLLWSEYIKAN